MWRGEREKDACPGRDRAGQTAQCYQKEGTALCGNYAGNSGGSYLCNFVPDADYFNHNQLLYVGLGNLGKLRFRICHKQYRWKGLHFGKGKSEIYSRYCFLQPVYYRAF